MKGAVKVWANEEWKMIRRGRHMGGEGFRDRMLKRVKQGLSKGRLDRKPKGKLFLKQPFRLPRGEELSLRNQAQALFQFRRIYITV